MHKISRFFDFWVAAICAALIIIFAPTALAEHHRGHNLGYVDNLTSESVRGHIESAQIQLNKVRNIQRGIEGVACANWTDDQHQRLSQLPTYIEKLQVKLDVTKAALERQGDIVAIDEARIAINQPVPDIHTGVGTNTDNSFVRVALNIQILGKFLIYDPFDTRIPNQSAVCPEAAKKVAQLIEKGAFVWRFGDLVAWHVVDAKLEEEFFATAQICGGPNNHCE